MRSVPAAAAAEAARAGTIGPGPGFVDRQRTALEVLAVKARDGLVGLFLVRHPDEAETAALARERVLDDGRAGNLAERRESIVKIMPSDFNLKDIFLWPDENLLFSSCHELLIVMVYA
jgi:hypothetical protein